MRRFLQLSGLFIAVQATLWTIIAVLGVWLTPRLDRVFEIFVFAYFPTITFVEQTHHYVGEANFIYPIFYGVLLGIPIYGIVAAALVCLITKRR